MFLTWPTTSTALPTLTDTGNGLSSVSNVTNILGSIKVWFSEDLNAIQVFTWAA